jgi:hypothetical protein
MSLGCFLFVYSSIVSKEKNLKFDEYTKENNMIHYIKITDNYDRRGYDTFSDFIESDNSVQKLKNLYHDLINSDTLKYLEIATQAIEFVGEYPYSDEFLYNGDISLKNQLIELDGGANYVTPLNSIQIGKETFERLELGDYVAEGNVFSGEDFVFKEDDHVSIILGHNYKEYLNIGDNIDVKFLTKDMNLQVIGFLNKDTSVNLASGTSYLDDTLLFPLFNHEDEIINDDIKRFLGILYSIKTEGFVEYESVNDYAVSTKEIEKLANSNQLKYSFIVSSDISSFLQNYNINISNLSIFPLLSALLLICSILIFVYTCIKMFNPNGKDNNISSNKLKLKIMSFVAIIFVTLLILVHFISFNYFRYTLYMIAYLQRWHLIFITMFTIMTCILIFLNFYLKNTFNSDGSNPAYKE